MTNKLSPSPAIADLGKVVRTVDPTSDQVHAITTAYEQGVGKGHDAYRRGVTIVNPYAPSWGCQQAWAEGYAEGREQAERVVASAQNIWTAAQLAPGETITDGVKRIAAIITPLK